MIQSELHRWCNLGYFPGNYVEYHDDKNPSKNPKLKLATKGVSLSIRQLQRECGFRTLDGKTKFNGIEVNENEDPNKKENKPETPKGKGKTRISCGSLTMQLGGSNSSTPRTPRKEDKKEEKKEEKVVVEKKVEKKEEKKEVQTLKKDLDSSKQENEKSKGEIDTLKNQVKSLNKEKEFLNQEMNNFKKDSRWYSF